MMEGSLQGQEWTQVLDDEDIALIGDICHFRGSIRMKSLVDDTMRCLECDSQTIQWQMSDVCDSFTERMLSFVVGCCDMRGRKT